MFIRIIKQFVIFKSSGFWLFSYMIKEKQAYTNEHILLKTKENTLNIMYVLIFE